MEDTSEILQSLFMVSNGTGFAGNDCEWNFSGSDGNIVKCEWNDVVSAMLNYQFRKEEY
jgi:hypothetical protein